MKINISNEDFKGLQSLVKLLEIRVNRIKEVHNDATLDFRYRKAIKVTEEIKTVLNKYRENNLDNMN